MKEAEGDWILYYEPRRDAGLISSGGRQAYVAVAFINEIIKDNEQADHYYATITNYLEFDNPIPFKEGNHYYESALRKPDGSTNRGAFRRAVRNISEDEFQIILRAGFVQDIEPWEKQVELQQEHPLTEQLIRRPFRDQKFKKQVRAAYNNTCAISGLCLINGGGRPEVEAAHIRPVSEHGPDSIRNGIALTGTVHWLLDRGLITFDEQYHVIVSDKADPDEMQGLVQPGKQISLPGQKEYQPHPGFIQWHRENIFHQ